MYLFSSTRKEKKKVVIHLWTSPVEYFLINKKYIFPGFLFVFYCCKDMISMIQIFRHRIYDSVIEKQFTIMVLATPSHRNGQCVTVLSIFSFSFNFSWYRNTGPMGV